jgi:vacuolar-type H+-ATPase subunit H
VTRRHGARRICPVDIGDIDAAYLDPPERCELLADRAEWSKHAMGAEIPPRNFSQIERGLEQALHNFAHNEVNSSELPPITAGERIDAIGNMSSRAITEASETTANDIEQAGQAAVEIAAEIMTEAQELAAQLRENGKKMGEHLREFALLAKKVSTAMRNTRAEVLNSEDPLPRAAVLPAMPDGETMQ